MKNLIICFLVATFSFLFHPSGHASEKLSEKIINKLEAEIIVMVKREQAIRSKISKAGFSNVTAKDVENIQIVDNKNTSKIKEIIALHGWEVIEHLDNGAKDGLLLIIEHSDEDIEFQKTALDELSLFFEKGQIKGQDFAILTDKILLAETRKQLYGTQVEIKNGIITPYPIEDKKKLDERRKSLNLPAMSKYIKILEEFYKTK